MLPEWKNTFKEDNFNSVANVKECPRDRTLTRAQSRSEPQERHVRQAFDGAWMEHAERRGIRRREAPCLIVK